MFLTPKEKQEGDPLFTLRDYLFGYNLGAATLQIVLAVPAIFAVSAVIHFLLG